MKRRMTSQITRPYGFFLTFLLAGPVAGAGAMLLLSLVALQFGLNPLGIGYISEAYVEVIVVFVLAAYAVFWVPAGLTGLVLANKAGGATIRRAQAVGTLISAAWTILVFTLLSVGSRAGLGELRFALAAVLTVSLVAFVASTICWLLARRLGLIG